MAHPLLNRRRLLGLIGLAPLAASVSAAAAKRAPVRVLWTRVNGELYYRMHESVASLALGDRVILRRESANPNDRRAIEVLDASGRKLGYVARSDNSAVGRMMDAGERFEARVGRIDAANLDIRLGVDWLPG